MFLDKSFYFISLYFIWEKVENEKEDRKKKGK